MTMPGDIISTNHPNLYNNNQNCTLTVTFSSTISIQFESFNIEQCTNCQCDGLEIRDGASSNSPLIGSKLCGNYIPETLQSSGNSVTFIFTSDYSVTRSGFKLKIAEGTNNS